MRFFKYSVYLFLLLMAFSGLAATKHINIVKPVVAAFKSGDKAAIAKRVHYPLQRKAPLQAIENEQMLIENFEQIFDKEFIEQIASSNIRYDWEMMGWRGIMFDSGKLWLDFDGSIWAVPYESEAEKTRREALIDEQKQALHKSLREFTKPILTWQTKQHLIRIDELADNQYRYAAWEIDQSMQDEPSLVITGGTLSFDGSGGNHFYTFTNNGYRYVCHVTVLGTEHSPPGLLEVFKNNVQILSEPASSF
ncbi:hypothetical protein EXT42_09390 [Pseudoalteromonas sp. CO302Y]|uniref:hypothetical protein n=1 Tax=unclassified Pseudoalteromonas TaxID=194690 RepID=UPI001023BC34|nr:hypothetical protein EXT42_09390 [Pseudoalteromonas sp. CO302Y]RZG09568.1 hypothetical protein EXT40_09400 [Pseudoalteromonas sp. CO133X]